MGIKVSPAFSYQDLDGHKLEIEVEIIGWNKGVKQAVWWIGELKQPDIQRQVRLLPSGWVLHNRDPIEGIPCCEPRQYIIDPHPAILRAQLADQFCTKYKLAKIDPHIGYFTSHDIPEFESPDVARVYRVIDVSKYNIRNLKKSLKTFHLTSGTLRQRGFPTQLPIIQKKLNLPEGNDCTILFTRIGASLYNIITEKVKK
jgi:hypothetical protein